MVKKKLQARRKQKIELGFGWVKPLLALLTLSGSAVGLTLMLEWMHDPEAWPVAQVRIDGEFRYLLATDLEREVAPIAAEGFFVMNVSDMQAHLQQLPWVEQVSVRRVWPDRLELRVREQQPVARWGEQALMNAGAVVFEPEALPELNALPLLNGPKGHEQRVLAMYRELEDLLTPLQLAVTRLSLSQRRTWDMQLSNGLTLAVGRNQPMARVARFVRVYPAILAAGDGQLSSVDLRYSNGFAVYWQQSDQTAKSAG